MQMKKKKYRLYVKFSHRTYVPVQKISEFQILWLPLKCARLEYNEFSKVGFLLFRTKICKGGIHVNSEINMNSQKSAFC